MKEKIDELYEQYLNEKLDLIFQGEGEEIDSKLLRKKIITNICNKKGYKIVRYYDFSFIGACVTKNYKYNFVDTKGNLVNRNEWYDDVYDFRKGYARVKRNGKCNLVDTKGNLINANEWYDNVYDFSEGYAIVKRNGKYNFIDTQGKLINGNEWYDDVHGFHKGYAKVTRNGKCNFIDTKGNLINPNEWYDDVQGFHEGYAKVTRNGKYNFIDTKGILINPNEWYDNVYDFSEGYAKVVRNGKCNFIDIQSKLINENEWYDYVDYKDTYYFCEGYAIVKRNGKYNFIDTKGNLINPNEWYDWMRAFHEGYAKVGKTGKCNFVNNQGNLINPNEWYDYADYFHDGYAKVERNGKWNFVNTQGNLINPNEWYDDVYDFSEGYAKVKRNGKWNFIDTQGKFYSKLFKSNIFSDAIKKRLFAYEYVKDDYCFKVRYEPIYVFNYNFLLCYGKKGFYLYDKSSNIYEFVGPNKTIYYEKKLLLDQNNKVYFLYNNQKIDITNYYYDILISKNSINIVNGVNINRILSKEEFALYNMEEIERILQEERKNNRKIKEEQRKQKQLEDLEKAKEQEKMEEEQRKQIEMNTLKSIQQALSVLQQVSSPSKTVTRINVDNIFIPVDDHLEIIPIIATMLRFVDLSWIRFDNVKVSGLDFSYSNIKFNPQMIYNKDLSNCNFEGVHIEPFMNFTGVDIRGAKFSDDDDIKTIDFFNGTFQYAIYDENTTYNGHPFTEIFSKETKQTKGGK